MPANDAMKETLEHFRQQRQKKLEELRHSELMINQLERELELEPTDFGGATSETDSVDPASEQAKTSKPKKFSIRGDDFFAMSQPEAARLYLKTIGHAASVEEILEALRKGGCEVGGADPKKVLYISMVRDTKNFVKLPNGMIGLREFYSDRKMSKQK